jgi:hypothetical protein
VKQDLEFLKTCGAILDVQASGYRWKREQEGAIQRITTPVRDVLIEGLLRVRSKGKGMVYLQPNRAQQEYSRGCTRRNIVLKARQLGITTYVAARFFIQTITQPGTTTVQVAHNQESAEEIFTIVHRFWENLPKATRCGALVRSHANVRQIVFPRIDSEYRVATAADPNAGRGLTIHNLHCSEVARWPRDGEETLASLRAAVPTTGEIVMESTPNGAGGIFYEEWQRADETGYTRHFFPWWYESSYVGNISKMALYPLTPEEEELVAKAGLSEAQLAYRRINRAQMRGLAAQEFAEDAVSCFRASGECVFDLEAIDWAFEACGEALETQDNCRLMIWWPPQMTKQYIIGVDPAGGGAEGDYSCAEVIDRATGMQCAELHGHFAPRELAGRLVELGKRYNEALLVVERNNHGHAVLEDLRHAGYAKVYREGNQEGWLTSAVSRPAMIENLAAVLIARPNLFHSPLLLNECRTFVRHTDGSSGAAAGAHDDGVMAMAIALAGRQRVAGDVSRRMTMSVTSLPARG